MAIAGVKFPAYLWALGTAGGLWAQLDTAGHWARHWMVDTRWWAPAGTGQSYWAPLGSGHHNAVVSRHQ